MGRRVAIFVLLAFGNATAGPPWKVKDPDPKSWTEADIQEVLTNSPWSQTANAIFPESRDDQSVSAYALPGAGQAGMAGPKGATDGRWDGGVSKNTGRGQVPILPVLVRWDTAEPVQTALERSGQTIPERNSKDYIITVVGLVSAQPSSTANDQQLKGLISHSALRVAGKRVVSPENVKVDGATGAVYLYFPRALPITKSDKDVLFTTRYGSLAVTKKFRLSEMTYHGRLEL